MVNGKQKGAEGEREFVKILQQEVDACLPPGHGVVFKRNLMQSLEGGYDITGLRWLALEIKRQENLSVGAWWQQCLQQAEGRVPVLAYRQNNKPWRVRMLLEIYGDKIICEFSIHDFLVVFRGMLRDPQYGVET